MTFNRDTRKLLALRNAFAQWQYPPNKESGLTNPKQRIEIPADFPQTISPYSSEEALAVIAAQLDRRGLGLEQAVRINIAYPHKHPGLHPNHHNTAAERAIAFYERMLTAAPQVEWVLAHALSERLHLNRSGNQSSFHALTAKQAYDVYLPAQLQPFPFADADSRKGELFVIVDNTIEQGTTIANMMSYITHNHGEVLMVQADRHAPVAQLRTEGSDLSPYFNDAARNSGRVPEMASAFAASARRAGVNWSPQRCIEKFEAALQLHGNSVFALTDGEAKHLIKAVGVDAAMHEPFPELVDKLEKSALGSLRRAIHKKLLTV